MARTLHLQTARGFILFLIMILFTLQHPSLVLGAETVHPETYYRTQLLSGFSKARQTVVISSEVGGKCTAFHAEIGTTIPVSGVLAEIDATYVLLDIQANRLERESVKRQLVTEKKMQQRYTTLLEKNSSTQAKLDEVTLSADLHEITIKTLNNQYQRLQANLARHKIKAPPGWTIINHMIEPGEYVQPGGPVATIGDFSQLIIPLALSFNELQILKKTSEISLYFPDLELQTFGQIYRVSPTYSDTTKKIPVDLIVEGKYHDKIIRGGLRAELHLQERKKDTYILPLSAVINRYDAYWVVKENSDRLRVLFLGLTSDGLSAILSSSELQEKDRVFTTVPDDF